MNLSKWNLRNFNKLVGKKESTMKSHSFQCRNIEDLQESLNNLVKTEFNPNLAIAFTSPKHDLSQIASTFSVAGIHLAGCTTAGEIVDNTMLDAAIVVLLLEIDDKYYEVKKLGYGISVYQAAFGAGQEIKEAWTNPGLLIMSGGIAIDADALIGGLQDGLGKSVPMFGGLAGDDLIMQVTHTFSNDFSSDNGAVLVVLDLDKVSMEGMAISGWEPVGGVNEITKAEANVVYQINEEPAYDVFMRYFGLEDSKADIDLLINIQTNYPFQIETEAGYILRSPILVDKEEKTITLAAGVSEGTKFRFSNAPGFEVIEQTINEFQQLKDKAPEADALILFSCKGRHGALGPMLEDEIQGLYDYWQKPMIGFLSYGEIGDKGNGVCAFHNETCSLVLLRER